MGNLWTDITYTSSIFSRKVLVLLIILTESKFGPLKIFNLKEDSGSSDDQVKQSLL